MEIVKFRKNAIYSAVEYKKLISLAILRLVDFQSGRVL
jgi:hypothetical protein